MSQEFFTPEDIEAILGSVNDRRLAPYIEIANKDESLGAHLYLWNMKTSSALWFAFHILEVTLRNSIDRAMTQLSKHPDWLEDSKILHPKELQKIDEARLKLHNHQKSVTHDRTIAELNFGFWRTLFQRNYHNALWEAGLKECFPNYSGKRSDIYSSLEGLVNLRNRIAHHEPIFNLNLEEKYRELVDLISYMNSNLAGLVERNSPVPSLLKLKPFK